MKPDWKKLFVGIIIVFIIFIALVVFDSNFHLLKLLKGLPKNQARTIGLSITIFIMLLFSVCGFVLSKKKGRNPVRWTLFCFLFHVWAFIYLWSLPDLKTKTENRTVARI